ncbi:MAG: GHMP kinase [Hyphomicrobiaceae bacterium]|nr:GHMP kinase [Hyphomicrobiaceae bacterium]
MTSPSPAPAVRVLAPARLHLGFLDLNGSLERRFGSLGLAIDQPATVIELSHARADMVSGIERERASRALDRFRSALGVAAPVHLTILEAIPAHAGLGSGTQLALAIGAALSALHGGGIDVVRLGEVQERGARSAIGMAAFATGGFAVDGGRRPEGPSAPVLTRHRFPPAWRILLVLDPGNAGVHGEREVEAFATLPPMRAETSAHLCRLTLMRLLPALAERDITNFGAAVAEIQAITGDHFAPAQGGRWASARVGAFLERLQRAGALGIGQSSWGPTGFCFTATPEEAERLYHSFGRDAKREGLELRVVAGRNSGATVATPPGAART